MSDYPPQVSPVDSFDDTNPKWPKVIGIISIVWGCVGLLCGGCGLISAAGFMPKQPGMETMPTGGTPLSYASLVLGFLVSVILISAGIVTLARKPAGKALHLVYAVLWFITIVLTIIAQLEVMEQMEQWMRDNADSDAVKAMSQFPMVAMQKGGLAIGIVIGAIYPIFCIIWFGIVKRKASMGSNEVSI